MRHELTQAEITRRNAGATPGRTPFGTEPSDTPTYFSETPSRDTPSDTRKQRSAPQSRYDASLPLDHFQAAYTSEDNSSFAGLLLADNKARRERHAWAWEAERKANIKAIKGRETREKLVEMTRKMVEADKDGMVKMINGGAGRPGDRMLLVQGLDAESDGRQHMIEGNLEEDGRLMITNGEKVAGNYFGKGKGKEVIVSEAAEAQYVDWDKPTVEEEEDNRAPRVVDMQIMMQGSLFKVSLVIFLTLPWQVLNICPSIESKFLHVPSRRRCTPRCRSHTTRRRNRWSSHGRTEIDSIPRYEIGSDRERTRRRGTQSDEK